MRKLDFDPAPLPLAFVLSPMVENSLRQSLLMSGGDPTIFASRPISGTLLNIILVVIVGQSALYMMRKRKKR